MWQKLREDGRVRRVAIAAAIYAVATIVYFSFASKQTRSEHTPFNHFALLAEARLQGRLDLPGPPPLYAQNNDFAEFGGKHFVSFPPFPAVLLLPIVKLAGSAERVEVSGSCITRCRTTTRISSSRRVTATRCPAA